MNRRNLTYAINFTILIFGIQATMLGPLLESMSHTFQITIAQMGLFFTVSMAGFSSAIIFGGVISDRVGKKKVTTWAGFGFALTLALFSLSSNLILSYFIFFITGGLGGILESTLSAMVADINPGQERRSVTMTHVFLGIGAIIGPLMAGWLVSSNYSWKIAYIVVSVFVLIAMFWVTRYEFPAVKEDEKIEAAAFKSIMSHKGFILLCIAMALYVGVETTLWGWTPKYLSMDLGYKGTFASLMVSLLWLGITVGRLISSNLAEKLPNKILVSALCFISMIGLFAQLSTSLNVIAPLTFFLLGMGLSGIWPLIVAEAGMMFRSKYTGTAFGIAVASGGIGGMTIPYIFGIIGEQVKMNILFATLTVPLILIVLIIVFIDKVDFKIEE